MLGDISFYRAPSDPLHTYSFVWLQLGEEWFFFFFFFFSKLFTPCEALTSLRFLV